MYVKDACYGIIAKVLEDKVRNIIRIGGFVTKTFDGLSYIFLSYYDFFISVGCNGVAISFQLSMFGVHVLKNPRHVVARARMNRAEDNGIIVDVRVQTARLKCASVRTSMGFC